MRSRYQRRRQVRAIALELARARLCSKFLETALAVIALESEGIVHDQLAAVVAPHLHESAQRATPLHRPVRENLLKTLPLVVTHGIEFLGPRAPRRLAFPEAFPC